MQYRARSGVLKKETLCHFWLCVPPGVPCRQKRSLAPFDQGNDDVLCRFDEGQDDPLAELGHIATSFSGRSPRVRVGNRSYHTRAINTKIIIPYSPIFRKLEHVKSRVRANKQKTSKGQGFWWLWTTMQPPSVNCNPLQPLRVRCNRLQHTGLEPGCIGITIRVISQKKPRQKDGVFYYVFRRQ